MGDYNRSCTLYIHHICYTGYNYYYDKLMTEGVGSEVLTISAEA